MTMETNKTADGASAPERQTMEQDSSMKSAGENLPSKEETKMQETSKKTASTPKVRNIVRSLEWASRVMNERSLADYCERLHQDNEVEPIFQRVVDRIVSRASAGKPESQFLVAVFSSWGILPKDENLVASMIADAAGKRHLLAARCFYWHSLYSARDMTEVAKNVEAMNKHESTNADSSLREVGRIVNQIQRLANTAHAETEKSLNRRVAELEHDNATLAERFAHQRQKREAEASAASRELAMTRRAVETFRQCLAGSEAEAKALRLECGRLTDGGQQREIESLRAEVEKLRMEADVALSLGAKAEDDLNFARYQVIDFESQLADMRKLLIKHRINPYPVDGGLAEAA